MRLDERIPRLLILCACAFLLGSACAAAQTMPVPSPKIEVNVSRVFLSVVVRDQQNRALMNLKQEDFQVFDNDKVQVISGFTVQQRASLKNTPAASPGTSTAVPPPPAATVSSPASQRFLVFVFDDMHLDIESLAAAKSAGTQALAGALVDSDMAAVVSTSGKVNSGLTRDRNLLKSTMLSLQPVNVYRTSGLECPDINYYQADLIVNKHDEPAFQDATRQELNCNPAVKDINFAQRQADSDARRTLARGDADVLATYAALREYVRRMAKLPGLRTLILISPGYITLAPDALYQESQLIDLAAQANVSISALDARGLYTTELEASEHSSSMQGGSVQQQSDYRRSAMALAEGSMASLADGTGGTFFHNRNDLGAGLVGLTTVPECVYLLELSPSNLRPDGTYHRLQVKVDREAVQVRARRGYFAPKPDKKK